MQSTPLLSETITVDAPVVLPCLSPSTHFAVVFEDDGKSGAIHGLDRSREEQPMLGHLLIYEVDNTENRDHFPQAEVDEQARQLCNARTDHSPVGRVWKLAGRLHMTEGIICPNHA